MSRTRVPKLLSLFYVHNPFYLISAALFVFGLKLLFRAGDPNVLFDKYAIAYIEPWGLLGSLAGVTVLMAVTAILIVRFGKVWEDARSLILIVLLMLLAISVSMDELINLLARHSQLDHLALMFGLGIGFAIAIGEFLILGLGIRFKAGYRLPLYGFLVLFFAWPALLLRELTQFDERTTQWLIAAFPVVAGVITLSLIPAIRKGAAHVLHNGTPWKWPLFPWTPFVFIALAVCFRSYSFTMSFDPSVSTHFWDTTFGIYQLIPFVLAVFVVLLEISIVEKLPRLRTGLLLVAPALLIPACPWIVPWSLMPVYSSFARSVTSDIASPVYLTAMGLALMYWWAAWRGIKHAEIGAVAALLLMAVIGPGAYETRHWQPNANDFSFLPLLALAASLVLSGVKNRRSLTVFVGLMFATFVGFKTATPFGTFSNWPLLVSVHLVTTSVILLGVLFDDEFASELKTLGPILAMLTLASSIPMMIKDQIPVGYIGAYAVAMTLLPAVLYRLLNDRNYLLVACIQLGLSGIFGCGIGVMVFARSPLPKGVKLLIVGAFSFFVAVSISVLKAGLSRRIRMSYISWRRKATS